LRGAVGALIKSGKSARDVYGAVREIQVGLTSNVQIARYVGKDGIAEQVEKVYVEMTGQGFPEDIKAPKSARHRHAQAHALEVG
jgi:hypothetical protein